MVATGRHGSSRAAVDRRRPHGLRFREPCHTRVRRVNLQTGTGSTLGVGRNPNVSLFFRQFRACGTACAFSPDMIRVRKRMPKRTPGDGLPQGVLGRREVVYQLTGQQRFAPGVYHDRRSTRDRRRPVWRQLMSGNVRCLQRSRGRRRDDHLHVRAQGPSLWLATGLALLLAIALRFLSTFE